MSPWKNNLKIGTWTRCII